MSFRLTRQKLRSLEWIQKCWMHFYCFLVKEITKWAEIFTGWFYYISLDSCKVWKHLQALYQRDSIELAIKKWPIGQSVIFRKCVLNPNYPKIHTLILMDSVIHSIAQCCGFRTVYMYSQAMDALHLPLYQFHQSPTIGAPFYCQNA